MEDLIKPHCPNMTETKATLLSKGLGKRSFSFTTDIVHLGLLNNNAMQCYFMVCLFHSFGLWLGVSGYGLPRLSNGICAAGDKLLKKFFYLELRHIVKYVCKEMFCKNVSMMVEMNLL